MASTINFVYGGRSEELSSSFGVSVPNEVDLQFDKLLR
jgi:hypothetical protein